jgi:hypothetical protein
MGSVVCGASAFASEIGREKLINISVAVPGGTDVLGRGHGRDCRLVLGAFESDATRSWRLTNNARTALERRRGRAVSYSVDATRTVYHLWIVTGQQSIEGE